MENKKLPIKIFEKRQEADERLNEAGGSDKQPKWVLTGQELVKRHQILVEELDVIEHQVGAKLDKYKNIPAVLTAKVSDEALAKTHRRDLSKLFYSKSDHIIGFTENQELLIKIERKSQLTDIKKKLSDLERNAKVISSIESLQTFQPDIVISENIARKKGKLLLKVRLLDYQSVIYNKQAFEKFESLMSSNKGLQLEKTVKYAENFYVHQIVADSMDALQNVEDFSAIYSIEPMPLLEVVEDDFFFEQSAPIYEPMGNREYPIVGVLDSGIANIPHIAPWIIGNHTNYPTDYLDPTHGTFVAGIVAFGDSLEQKEYTGVNGCYLYNAAVIPDSNKEAITEAELVDNIREVVEKNREKIKVWNLSIGSRIEIKDSDFSEFAMALDNIQEENDVLIIKSASNCTNFLNGAPIGRITNGADSVRSITVGSIAQSKLKTDLSEMNHISPFSRVGPGPANIIKPDLVHYGGNSGIDNGRRVDNGVHSYSLNATLTKKIGTSFSTPRIAAIAADLHHRLNESFDPVLIKALIIHSAKYPEQVGESINNKLNQMGFGMPSTAAAILFNDPSEITLILRDTLNKGEFVEILDFPFPESLIDEEGYYYGQVILTLVTSPILVPGQATEYCQSDIEVNFGTYDEKTQRDTSKKTIRNPIGRNGAQNLLNSSIYSKKKPSDITKRFALTEKMLVQYGDKFYPNKKYAIDLTEMTQGKKEKFIQAPKRWYLKVTGLYRDYIEKKAEIERMGLSQEFCIALTIRDPHKNAPVYDEVTKLLNMHNFIHRDIKITQQIDVRLEG